MNLNKYIDHTLLKPDATADQITQICHEAKTHGFKSVCINSSYVPFAQKLLKETDVKICTVVGFPLGASPKEVKALEADMAIIAGASEIDMVINISAAKNGLFSTIENEVKLLVETCHKKRVILKVIFETCLLTDDEIVKLCQICTDAGADFVKTSTGFSTGGATINHVKLMKANIGDNIEVKASGGIRDEKTAKDMITAGATRLGTSSGVKIINGEESDSAY